MTKAQELQVRQSEVRQKLNTLLSVETRTAEQNTELEKLTGEAQKLEPELRAAIAAEPDPEVRTVATGDAEGREYRGLLERCNFGTAVVGAIECRQMDGAEGELVKHHSLPANQVPLDLFRDRQPETRATTTAPSDTQAAQQPIVAPVFAMGDTAFLQVAQRTVPIGDAVFPVLEVRPAVAGPYKDGTDAPETNGTFSADVLPPSRLQASYIFRRSDAARFPMMPEAFRQALGMGLSESLDKELIDQIVVDVARTDAAAVQTFATYRSKLVYDAIDGRFAMGESEIRLLLGSATLAHAAGQYRSNNADDSAVDSLRRISGGLRVSAHVAAVAASKQDVVVRKGSREDAAVGMWAGVEIIDDPYSGSGKGERELTAVLLAAFKVTRPAGFRRIQVQHA